MNTALFFITHDGIASSLLQIGEAIIGKPVHNIGFYEVAMDSSIIEGMQIIESKIADLDCQDEIIFITDIVGATPSNLANELAQKYNAKLISGMNLAMVIRLFNYRNENATQLIDKALNGARDSITEVS